MFLILATAFFGVYIANVLMGALAASPVLGDVGEMLVLFAASVFFVVAILRREKAAKKDA